jgi:FADH2 O2-dependent halogenase
MTSGGPLRIDADVAVIGSGFAGALTALCLRQTGRDVALVERGRHPRFAIGESSTPLAALLLEELADRYHLPGIRVFSKWGTWQRARPDVACGLKRGFSFYFHAPGKPFGDDPGHERQLLVAASPHDEIADAHWYRPDFDHALVREAEAAGAIHLDETRVDAVAEGDREVVLEATRNDRSLRIAARFLIDASGPRGCLHRLLGLGEAPLRWLPPTQGLYTHFRNVRLWHRPSAEEPPYPPDAAALHHVFPGGWIWALRFNNGITSAGAALTDEVAATVRAADGATAWARLLAGLPDVARQFENAEPVLPFIHSTKLGCRTRRVRSRRWALLPSAAGVIDPLLSTGFPLTLLGIGRLLDILETTDDGEARERALATYAEQTQEELDVTEQLVGALYATMTDPALFKRLALLYFAAASYSEAAWRLGRPGLAPGFMLHRDPRFGPELRACSALALQQPAGDERAALMRRIEAAIAPFDTAGLLDADRRHWYPVRAEDLLANAWKLGAGADDIARMLARCGFSRSVPTH